ncbi:DUF3488 and DUF4129 domain-containing transglutaminase family protein [Thermodesulfobacteriota bacterium]
MPQSPRPVSMISCGSNKTASTALPALVTVIICSVPHFFHISAVAVLICITIWVYQAISLRHRLPVPGLLLRTFAGAALFAIAVGLNDGLTLEAFVTLLIFAITLKTFELRTKRDSIVTIILCYFLIFSSMLFNDSIFVFSYLLVVIVSITAALISVNFPRSSLSQILPLAGKLFLQAAPFMVVLFLLFPRIQGGLWGRPPVLSSTSGFTDEISFNSISRVAQSREVAFRVSFAGGTPRSEQLYWRGIVLPLFDGTTWKEAQQDNRRIPRSYSQDSEKTTYTVTLEPHNHRQLLALDLPSRVLAPRTRARSDHTWVTWRPVTSRLQYKAESLLEASPPATEPYSAAYLQLPDAGNSQALAMAATWRSESDSDKEYVEKVINFFKSSNFTYTLNPKAIPQSQTKRSAIDAFLFDTREGFCEHYASAFAFLMRAGGIPIRLVAGYLGGEVNPYGDYMVVRQSDAHVWCEVFLDGETWQRIDPTLVVAPARASGRMAIDLAAGIDPAASESETKVIPSFLKTFADFGDLINNRWNNWVLGYSRTTQVELFQWMGVDLHLPGGVGKASVVGLVLLATCGFMALGFISKMKDKRDKICTHWQKFCAKMEKAGIPRPAHQGPMAYAQRIFEQRSDLEGSVSEITNLYAQLRFNPQCSEDMLPRFMHAVESFIPHHKNSS